MGTTHSLQVSASISLMHNCELVMLNAISALCSSHIILHPTRANDTDYASDKQSGRVNADHSASQIVPGYVLSEVIAGRIDAGSEPSKKRWREGTARYVTHT